MYYSIWCCLVLASSIVLVQSIAPQYFDKLSNDLSLLLKDPSAKDKITWERVEEAAAEWEHMGKSERDPVQKDQGKSLVSNSVILPFIKKASEIKDKNLRENWLKKTLECYKFFEPYYLRKKNIGEPVLYASAPKSDLIFKVAIGALKDKLETTDFSEAKREIDRLYDENHDIVESGNVCVRSERLKMVLNRINLPFMRELIAMLSISDEDKTIDSDVDELLRGYRRRLRAQEIKVLVDDNGSVVSDGKISDLAIAIEKLYVDRTNFVRKELIGEAIEEYRGLSQKSKDMLDLDPRLRMLVDFAILATYQEPALIKQPWIFLDQILLNYFKFRPGYVEQKTISEELPDGMPSFTKLIKYGIGDYYGQLSKQELIGAKSEFEYRVNRINRYSRIYQIYRNVHMLERALNFQNDERSKIFVQSIYPEINEEMDPIKVLEIFKKALAKELPDQFYDAKGEEAINELREALEGVLKSESMKNKITVELIKQALAEYERLNQSRIQKLNSDDVLRMVVDFAILPMKYEIENNTESGPQQFVERLVKQYKRFRPYYVGKNYNVLKLPPRMTTLWYIVELAQGRYGGRIETEDFMKAKSEIDYWNRKYKDLEDSYIYDHLNEWEYQIHFENVYYTKVFMDDIYPMINENIDPLETLLYYRERLRLFSALYIPRTGLDANIKILTGALEASIRSESEKNPVTPQLVLNALAEYENWSMNEKKRRLRDMRLRIVLDLAILPMRYEFLHEGKIPTEEFIDRLTKAYKRFRPSYLDKKYIGDETIPKETDAILRLISIARNAIDEKPTEEDFSRARDEVLALVDKNKSFAGESEKYANPYGNLVELEKIRNMLNYPAYQIFQEYIIPYMTEEGIDPERLIRKFREYIAHEEKITEPNIKP